MSAVVSIVVPTCNVERYLRRCMDSLLAQTLADLEFICVDDGSTDASGAILDEYAGLDDRVRVIHRSNGGYGGAVNAGLALAGADWVGIVEPDDFIEPDMFARLHSGTKAFSDAVDVVKGGYWDFFDLETHTFPRRQMALAGSGDFEFAIQDHPELLNCHPSVWSCIYRRSFLAEKRIRMVEAPGGGWVDNPFFYETMLQARRIVWINSSVYHYRQYFLASGNKLADCEMPMKRSLEIMQVYQRLGVQDPDLLRPFYKRFFHYVDMIEQGPGFSSSCIRMIESVVRWMQEDIVAGLNERERDIWRTYGGALGLHVPAGLILLKTVACEKMKRCLRDVRKAAGVIRHPKALVCGGCRGRACFKLPPKSRTRIMFVASDNNRTSGAFISMVALNRILRERHGYDTFVVLPNPGNGQELLQEAGVPFVLVESRDWVLPIDGDRDALVERLIPGLKLNDVAVGKLEKIIRENEVDVVHINTTYSYVGALAALKCRTPLVWHLREFLEEDQQNTLWDREKGNALIGKADRIIAISQSIRRKYENVFDAKRLVCIMNGIDEVKFHNPAHDIFKRRPLVFTMVGGFEVYKGHLDFANACAELYKGGFRDFEVWFVGTGKREIRRQCEKILNAAGMEGKVLYLGYRKNVETYLAQSDVAFTCSRSEAFGRITVEAMMAGCLAVGAACAGTAELIQDGKTGLLFQYEPGDWNGLVDRMKWAIANSEDARKIAVAGREYMIANMTAARNAMEIAALYREVLGHEK